MAESHVTPPTQHPNRRKPLLWTIPLGLILAIVPIGLASAASGPPCGLPTGSLTPADLPEGSSVTKCQAVGRVIREKGQGVTIPAPGTGVQASSTRADGQPRRFGVQVSTDGKISYLRDAEAGSARRVEGSTGLAATAPSACNDGSYKLTGWKTYSAYKWYIGDGGMPGALSQSAAQGAFADAINNITGSYNNCSLTDQVSATSSYQGTTTYETDMNASGDCLTRDKKSTWDAGDLPSGTIAMTCTYYSINLLTKDEVLEADVRYNTHDFDFTDNPGSSSCSNKYDVRGIGTHEAGHIFGLDDLYGDDDNLTMYGYGSTCTSMARTLGKGDVLGLRALY